MKNCIEINATSNQGITITQEGPEKYLRWLPGTRIRSMKSIMRSEPLTVSFGVCGGVMNGVISAKSVTL